MVDRTVGGCVNELENRAVYVPGLVCVGIRNLFTRNGVTLLRAPNTINPYNTKEWKILACLVHGSLG